MQNPAQPSSLTLLNVSQKALDGILLSLTLKESATAMFSCKELCNRWPDQSLLFLTKLRLYTRPRFLVTHFLTEISCWEEDMDSHTTTEQAVFGPYDDAKQAKMLAHKLKENSKWAPRQQRNYAKGDPKNMAWSKWSKYKPDAGVSEHMILRKRSGYRDLVVAPSWKRSSFGGDELSVTRCEERIVVTQLSRSPGFRAQEPADWLAHMEQERPGDSSW